MLRNTWQITQKSFDEIDHQVRVQYGLIEEEEGSKAVRQLMQILTKK